MTGVVTSLKIDRGFGFLTALGAHKATFFHCHDLDSSLPFDDTLLERRVEFNVIETDKGPRAVSVRAAR